MTGGTRASIWLPKTVARRRSMGCWAFGKYESDWSHIRRRVDRDHPQPPRVPSTRRRDALDKRGPWWRHPPDGRKARRRPQKRCGVRTVERRRYPDLRMWGWWASRWKSTGSRVIERRKHLTSSLLRLKFLFLFFSYFVFLIMINHNLAAYLTEGPESRKKWAEVVKKWRFCWSNMHQNDLIWI